jgi:putative transposase
MLTIGSPVLSPAVPNSDAAVRLIFPALEAYLPPALDRELLRRHSGAWHFDVLNRPRLLRLELLQACRPDFSFQEVLREVWQAWRGAACVSGTMPNSGSLATARARLPAWTLETLFKHTVTLGEHAPPQSPWPGHRFLTMDGTLLALPNTPLLRAHFGTTRHQHGEAYYPQALAVWLSLLTTAAVLAEHLGPARQGEESIAPGLLTTHLRPGDVVLGDGRIGTYASLAQTVRAQAFFLFRAPGPLHVEQHLTQRLAPDDADLVLHLTPYMRERYRELALPPELPLRVVSCDIPARDRFNATVRAHFLTNLPRALFPAVIVARMARLRWGHETLNNDIKTRLGLGAIRSQTPAGVRCEVLAHLCLANLLHLLLAQAWPLTPLLGSFTAARSALYQLNQQLRLAPERQTELLNLQNEMLCQQPLDLRPDRSEPRMVRPRRRNHRVFKMARTQWRALRQAG